MRVLSIVAGILLSSAWHAASAQVVTIYPGGPTPLYPANPGRGYVDFVNHDVLIANTTAGAVTVRSVRVEALRKGEIIAMATLDRDDMLSVTRDQVEMRAQGMSAMADIMLPAAAIGVANHFVAEMKLPPHGAMAMGPVYIAVHGNPTSIRIRATVVDAQGTVRQVETMRPTVGPDEPHAYAFPLRGPWFQRSVPNVTSHHRWNAPTEYAMDYWKLDSAGSPSSGKVTRRPTSTHLVSPSTQRKRGPSWRSSTMRRRTTPRGVGAMANQTMPTASGSARSI